jgi:NTP pyrophosphatase (non-canonical NTP hydrolase)
MIGFNDYQVKTNLTAIYPKDKALEYLVLGLASEAGEVAGKLKKYIRDNDSVVGVHGASVICSELGDVLWYISQIALELNTTLESVAQANIEKLSDRKTRGVIGGSGDSR